VVRRARAGGGGLSSKAQMKTDYLKFVQWSDEDSLYVGYCPDLFVGGVSHGKNKRKVYSELCALIDEDVKSRVRKTTPLPRRAAIVAVALTV
jgi:hypothetical protein